MAKVDCCDCFIRLVLIGCSVCTIVIPIIVLPVYLTWHHHDKTIDYDSMKDYILTDKVIESTGNYHFCQGLTATSTSQPSDPSNATLYLLSSHPQPSQFETFITQADVMAYFDPSNIKSNSWQYYLNTGSVVSLYFSYDDRDLDLQDVQFYLIKGQANHNKWVKNSECSCVVDHQGPSDRQTLNYHINETALYSFSFLVDEYDDTLYVNFYFN